MSQTDILILSDTHGRDDLIPQTVRLAHPHLMIFCGDGLRDFDPDSLLCPLYAVRGNCDWSYAPHLGEIGDSLSLNFDGVKLLITHGHRFSVKHGLGALVSYAVQENVDAVIFGHTHEPLDILLSSEHAYERFGISLNKPLQLFNPGSLGYAPHSFGTLTIRNGISLFGHGRLELK